MSNRFYVSEPIQCGTAYSLDSTESHHITNVMRAKVNDSVTLFDGSGAEFEAEISEISRKSVKVKALAKREISRELDFELVIGIPVPKGDRQKVLIEKMTELGVTRLYFLTTARSNFLGNEKTIRKLARHVIEAAKQCGRNRLMEISGPVNLHQFAKGELIDLSGFEKKFAHPYGTSTCLTTVNNSHACALIGPEGGFSDAEFNDLKEAGWDPFSLGRSILRMETAAIASAAILANRNCLT